ncbi:MULTISPECIES: alpha/beta hydrolase [unclassified Kitasatospora]|uniref:alpha/beta hydrolase n=1 Tax=unclassified Kitasatospora TaxID=2633591 RepID=UPI0033C1E5F2
MDIKTLYDADINDITIAKNAFDKLYSAFGQHIESWQHEVVDRLANSQWSGTASDHAQARIRFLGTELQSAHSELDFVGKALAKAAEQFALAQSHLVYALDDAKDAKLTVAPDGGITWDKDPASPTYAGAGAETTAIAISNRITAALNEAAQADQEISARLNHFATNASNGTGLDAATVAKDQAAETGREQVPASGTDPNSVKQWWNGLTDSERQKFINDHPDQVGNLDGVPATARDQANRINMKRAKQDLQSQLDGLGPEPKKYLSVAETNGGPVENPDYDEWQRKQQDLKEKLASIADIESRLSGDKLKTRGEPAFLMGFDTKGKGRAIISVNNPDTADNVVTFVPGTHAKFGTAIGDVDKADEMVRAAKESDPGSPKTTAAIAWVGYDAPQSLFPEASSDSYAENAEKDLARFQTALRATHEGNPSHNTLMGHSYGTVAVGFTMRDHKLPVDDVILVGSPGVGVDHAKDLNIDPSHVYVARGSEDTMIKHVASTGLAFGLDPVDNDFGARHLPAGSTDHSHYWLPGSVSVKAFGAVIAGNGVGQ